MSDPSEALTVELTREQVVALAWLGSARLGGKQSKAQGPPADTLVVAARDQLAAALGEPDAGGMTG